MQDLGNKTILAKNLKRLMLRDNVSAQELSKALDYPYTTLLSWLKADNYPRIDKIEAMAQYFRVLKSELIEDPTPAIPGIEYPTFRSVPLLGEIACGEPILAQENVDGDVNVDSEVACDFALRCKGDSMAPRLLDGDLVFIKQQPSVDNGQIAAVLIDTEATLKHVYVQSTSIQLVAENPAYAPIILTGEDAQNARILGKAVAYRRCL